jgi:sigma-E factor negative regulatory protein RseC
MENIEENSEIDFRVRAIKHEGIVSKINGSGYIISLKGDVNCEGCKAKSACGVSESNDKEIEVFESDQTFCLNEPVTVSLKKELGLKAVFWAYVFPFILIMATLVISSNFFTEWLAGILSLLVLGPYYLMLFVFNNLFKKAFKVSILKI